ncbi:signal peptide peptidase SppA [Cyclobacterium jeungdonense]|uniref:Signal peptide peptidase SppA n=1 Tax=Cyclobacterium jeungdonense TaxID=708087 RepID=A0ABT8C355_9BACT|nr:signal peptide peptidase SppA [Cyclobacterium jeungdonense]MDN3686736.1 signal peptide peptidase SppA [Cyclobacterium jeungdonense]
MKFLSNVLAVIVGMLVFWVLAFFIMAGIIAISAGSGKIEIEENSLLHIRLNGVVLVEQAPEDDMSLPPLPFLGSVSSVGLNQVIRAIETAKENPDIKGIYLESGLLAAGQSHILEIRNALKSFKESGKFIVAYGEYFSETGYFLCSVADEIYLNPIGDLEFNGFAANPIFLKGLLDKIEVEPVIFRVGEFKSAIEPFIMEKMSEENRLQTSVYLEDLNQVVVNAVAESRSLSVEKIQEINDNMSVRTSQDAVDLGLIDALWYDDQVKGRLREKLGLEEEDDINSVNISGINQTAKEKNRLSRNQIAVIMADGEIVGGQNPDQISSDLFLKEIRKARKNEDVKAIVLRINSPGGSVVASEVLWRELSEAQKEKPLIASMSNYAASGGYYLAAPADTIVAQPNTITGSIGIFGILFNMQGLLNNKLGITTDVVSTGTYSDFLNPTKPMSESEKAIMQNKVEEGYDTFIQRVADGRKMSREEVIAIAGGRVWSGTMAKNIGLVDILGGFDDAIHIAAHKAGLEDDYRVVLYPKQKTLLEQLLSDFGTDVQSTYHRIKFGASYDLFQQVDRMKKLEGRMALLPFLLDID